MENTSDAVPGVLQPQNTLSLHRIESHAQYRPTGHRDELLQANFELRRATSVT